MSDKLVLVHKLGKKAKLFWIYWSFISIRFFFRPNPVEKKKTVKLCPSFLYFWTIHSFLYGNMENYKAYPIGWISVDVHFVLYFPLRAVQCSFYEWKDERYSGCITSSDCNDKGLLRVGSKYGWIWWVGYSNSFDILTWKDVTCLFGLVTHFNVSM